MFNWITAFEIVAGVASITGLAVTILAWRRAKGAEKAAQEAREAIRRANAADDMRRLLETAKELLACVQRDQLDAACLCCRDLVAGVSETVQRWTLPEDTQRRLNSTARRVRSVSEALMGRGEKIDADERARLIGFAHQVVADLGQEAGKAARTGEPQ